MIGTEGLRSGIITNVACLDDNQILAMFGVGAVAIGCNNTANHAMVERKGTEVLGDQDNRIALVFIRAESAGRHDFARFESQRLAQIVQSRYKPAVTHHVINPKIADDRLQIGTH